ncbi:MAG: methyl-accepting chemotaxis protein [Leptospiraceae bacterium]|nr:methyl-accepting chemotaxis protein [Leptospiraceae bacterium]
MKLEMSLMEKIIRILNNITIKWKIIILILTFSGFFIMLLLLFIPFVFKIHEKNIYYTHLIDRSRIIQVDFKIQVQEWKNILLRGSDVNKFHKYKTQFLQKSEKIQKDLQYIEKTVIPGSEIENRVNSLEKIMQNLEKIYLSNLEKYYNPKNLNSIKDVDKAVEGIDREPTEKIGKLVDTIAQTAKEETYKIIEIYLLLVVSVSFIIFVMILFFLIALSRSIHRPIKKIGLQMEEIASGEVSLNVKIIMTGNDEIATLGNNFNAFLIKLKNIITENIHFSRVINESIQKLKEVTGVISENFKIQSNSTLQIQLRSNEVNLKSEENSQALEKQLLALSGLFESIDSLSLSLSESEEKVENSSKHSESLSARISEKNKTLIMIKETMKNMTDNSKKIESIIGIIHDISEQINLLSLNASIEAARAGDEGKGFSVVASEVSKLADRTSASLKEIETLIKKNNKELNDELSNVNTTIEFFMNTIKEISDITESIKIIQACTSEQFEETKRITEKVNIVKNLSNSLERETVSNRESIRLISEEISNLNRISQTNDSKLHEVKSISDNIVQVGNQLEISSSQFKI